jgi:hypothetical protein
MIPFRQDQGGLPVIPPVQSSAVQQHDYIPVSLSEFDRPHSAASVFPAAAILSYTSLSHNSRAADPSAHLSLFLCPVCKSSPAALAVASLECYNAVKSSQDYLGAMIDRIISFMDGVDKKYIGQDVKESIKMISTEDYFLEGKNNIMNVEMIDMADVKEALKLTIALCNKL